MKLCFFFHSYILLKYLQDKPRKKNSQHSWTLFHFGETQVSWGKVVGQSDSMVHITLYSIYSKMIYF